MAATSTMLPLGTEAPDFALPDLDGTIHHRDDFAGAPALVVAFICNHCPYVVHIRKEWAKVAQELQERGVAVVAIAANDVVAYPQDGPKGMAEEAREYGYTFPYLFDETQQVAQAYCAACTPDFYVFDRDRKLAYRGQFDDSRPRGGGPVTGADLQAAVDAVLAGQPAPEDQRPSMGCNIKWKPGNEPGYYG
ncbi:MAG: thioredoxin family protein [Actinobacteria bacterium]|nr:thioredoxin family protein [Actinomycetota bacterium]